MENQNYFFNYIFRALIPISSNSTSFTEMDYLSRTLYCSFIAWKTVKLIGGRISYLSGSRYLRPDNSRITSVFTPISPKKIVIDSNVTSKNVRVFSSSADKNEDLKMMNSLQIYSTLKHENGEEEPCPKKKLKTNNSSLKTEKSFINGKAPGDGQIRPRPNYFVAVQISDPIIHGAVKEIQDHIVKQNKCFNNCMISPATLHITLMVVNISDKETHERAMKALHNVYDECNNEMCQKPLTLEFKGLGNFKNTVLFAKIKENESFERLHNLAECVKKHFAAVEIFSTDKRTIFKPHLTIAKIDFSNKRQRALKKIHPSLYEAFIDNYLGSEKILGIQLLSMTGRKDDAGYYSGHNLIFETCTPIDNAETINLSDITKKKEEIRMKVALLAMEKLK